MLKTYLSNHKIVQIGIPSSEYIYCEIIVDNPNELISIIQESEYYISHIRWWDYVKIGFISPIGYGGTRNPNNTAYYFAETDIYRNFDTSTTVDEYLNYLAQIRQKYDGYSIYPAFDIKRQDCVVSGNTVC